MKKYKRQSKPGVAKIKNEIHLEYDDEEHFEIPFIISRYYKNNILNQHFINLPSDNYYVRYFQHKIISNCRLELSAYTFILIFDKHQFIYNNSELEKLTSLIRDYKIRKMILWQNLENRIL